MEATIKEGDTTTDTNTSFTSTNSSIDDVEEVSEEEIKKAEEFKT